MLRLLIAASVATWIVACASSPKESMPPPSFDPRPEIDELDREIDTQLAKLQVQPLATTCAATSSCSAEPPPAERACAAAPSCEDTCTLGESICKNATRICEIANQQLGSVDAYANEKCQRGVESCKAARERCCACKPTGEL